MSDAAPTESYTDMVKVADSYRSTTVTGRISGSIRGRLRVEVQSM